MKTSNLITSSLAALAVVGSVGLVFAQTTTPGSTTDQSPGVTTQQNSGSTGTTGSTGSTPMNTPQSGSMNSSSPSTTDSMNNNASMNEPVARNDRN